MSQPPDSREYRPELLSTREREVLTGAVQGLSDDQIAQTLGISTTTVNTYWVRIRGKLGSLSRTELVSAVLRREAYERQRTLLEENRRLAGRLREATERVEELLTTNRALRGESRVIQAMLRSPQATVITDPSATIVSANFAAYHLYGAKLGELEGVSMRDLTVAETPESLREPCRRLFEPMSAETETIGLTEPYYALRRDGTNFRAVVRAARFESGGTSHAVATVTKFLEDLGPVVAALRRPIASQQAEAC